MLLLCTNRCHSFNYKFEKKKYKVMSLGRAEINLPLLTLIQNCLIPKFTKVGQKFSLNIYSFLPSQKSTLKIYSWRYRGRKQRWYDWQKWEIACSELAYDSQASCSTWSLKAAQGENKRWSYIGKGRLLTSPTFCPSPFYKTGGI